MKAILKNNKMLIAISGIVIALLAVAVLLPTVFAERGSGEIVSNSFTAVEEQTDKTEQTVSINGPIVSQNTDIADAENGIGMKVNANNVTIGDYILDFTETKQEEGIVNPVNVFENGINSLKVDSVTNKIVELKLRDYILPTEFTKAENMEQVQAVAEKFAAMLCDNLEKYNSRTVTQTEILGEPVTTVVLTRKIGDYATSETMWMKFDKNYNLYYYYCKPDVFDGFDTSNIVVDEKAVIQHVKNKHINYWNEKFGDCKIESMTLTVNDNKVQMLVESVALDKEGEPLVQGGVMMCYVDIQ